MKQDIHDVYVARICAYIDEHLTEELTYKHFREKLGVTQHHLTGRFPKVMNTTLTDYIIKKRLQTVISKVNCCMKIEEAVYTSGFRTYSHFYKEFRKNFGSSPRAYFREKAEK